MLDFNDKYLQDIQSCEMKNFDGPLWFLQDMAFRIEFRLLPNCREITPD